MFAAAADPLLNGTTFTAAVVDILKLKKDIYVAAVAVADPVGAVVIVVLGKDIPTKVVPAVTTFEAGPYTSTDVMVAFKRPVFDVPAPYGIRILNPTIAEFIITLLFKVKVAVVDADPVVN